MKNKIFKNTIVIFVVAYIIFLFSSFKSTSLSRYKDDNLGSGSMRIARWEVSVDTDDNESDSINLISGNNSIVYNVKVISASEVDLSYDIVITGVPTGVQVNLDGYTTYQAIDSVITMSNVGSFTASDNSSDHNHVLTFSAPLSAEVVNNGDTNIQVIFNQEV